MRGGGDEIWEGYFEAIDMETFGVVMEPVNINYLKRTCPDPTTTNQ